MRMKVRVTEGVLLDDAKQTPLGEECVEKGSGEVLEKKESSEVLEKKSEQTSLKKSGETSLKNEEERILRVASEKSCVDSIVLCEVSVSRRHSSNLSTSNRQTSLLLSTLFVTLLSSSHL